MHPLQNVTHHAWQKAEKRSRAFKAMVFFSDWAGFMCKAILIEIQKYLAAHVLDPSFHLIVFANMVMGIVIAAMAYPQIYQQVKNMDPAMAYLSAFRAGFFSQGI